MYWLKVHEIPDVGPQGKGKAVVNLVQLQPAGEDRGLRARSRSSIAGRYVLLATRKGIVKKTELDAFANPRPAGIIALGVEDDDALIEAVLTSGKDEVLLGHPRGHGHPLQRGGRAAHGPRRLRGEGHRARERATRWWPWRWSSRGGTVLTVTENGYGKRTAIEEYRLQSRGRQGDHQHQDQRAATARWSG